MRWLPALLALSLGAAAASSAFAGHGARVLRVGFVAYTGARQDRGVGQASYEGFRRAVIRLGLKGHVIEVAAFLDPKPALMSLARQRYDLVVDAAPFDLRGIVAVAAAFPKIRFLVPDVPHHDLPGAAGNVQTFVFRSEEAGYLAGYVAASMETRRPGKDVIGSVGGFPSPQVEPFIAGYQAGARKADPGVTTLNGYSRDFGGPAKCRAIALGQISRGAGVIFSVAGGCGLGALAAARTKHVWGIGVDIDQSFLGPHILTSAVKRYDVAIYSELEALKDGRFRTGGTTFLGLKERGVGLGRISPNVPPAVRRDLARVQARVVAGKIRVPSRVS